MAALDTLIHNDTYSSDWTDTTTGNGSVSTNDTEFTTTFTSDGNNQEAYRDTAAGTWSLDESSIYVRIKQQGSSTPNGTRIFCQLLLVYDANNSIEWELDYSGTLRAYQTLAGSQTQKGSGLTFGAAYEWWRIRETGGTIYWDTAPDSGSGTPGTWTNRATSTDALQLSNLTVRIGVRQNYDGESAWTAAIWDSVNGSAASGGSPSAAGQIVTTYLHDIA